MVRSAHATVDEFVAALEGEAREVAEAVRALVRRAVPDATEGMEYGMPYYRLAGADLAGFAVQKRHFALYVCDAALVDGYRDRLGPVDCGKGCIRFKRLADLPLEVAGEILGALATKRRGG